MVISYEHADPAGALGHAPFLTHPAVYRHPQNGDQAVSKQVPPCATVSTARQRLSIDASLLR
jgi:hypothetical protein